MKQWFYVEAGGQKGPVNEHELRQLLDTRRISPGTLVWCEGMPEWVAADAIGELAPSPYAPPVSVDDPGINWSGYEPSGPQSRPWVRYWARTFDTLMFAMLAGFVLELTFPSILETSDALFGIGIAAFYNVVEPLCFAACGTTPMKALLKVRVRNKDGSKLSYFRALRRTVNVWIRGEGLGIPVVSLITHITSYSRLNNHGATSWDVDGGYTVSHQEIEWWRWLILILVIVGFGALVAVGQTA